LDSGDPRWTNHAVSVMYSRNWRYSDCQFSATSTAKSEEVTYCSRLIRSTPSATACSL